MLITRLARGPLVRSTLRLLAVGLLLSTAATAGVSIEIDADPTTPEIQSSRNVQPGETFEVEVRVTGLAQGAGLNAYELDLSFDEAVVTASTIADGGLLPTTTRVVEQDVSPPDANLALIQLGVAAGESDGVLARVTFEAQAAGTSALHLNDVVLSGPLGARLSIQAASDATIEVPEPGTWLSAFAALCVLAVLGRGRRRQAISLLTLGVLAFSGGVARAGDTDPIFDTNGDGFVNILDVSLVAGCAGVDPADGNPCDAADVDEDGDVDGDDLDAVIAAFGGLSGPPFVADEPLFDCTRDGYPCAYANTDDAVLARVDVLLGGAQTRLNGGASIDSVADWLEGEADVVQVEREGWSVFVRVANGPPIMIHDGTRARGNGLTIPPIARVVPTAPNFPGLSEPVGHRVVGRDRDEDGRRDRAKKALILSPYQVDFEPSNTSDVALDALFEFDEYEIEYYENDEVTLEHYLGWEDYDLIFVETHGDAISGEINSARSYSQALYLGEFAPTCVELKQSLMPITGGVLAEGISCSLLNRAAAGEPNDFARETTVTPRFFGQRYPDGLENALIWLDACRSFRVPGFQLELTGKHSVFFGWDDYVYTKSSVAATRRFFELTANKGLRTSRAWQILCEEDKCIGDLDAPALAITFCYGEDPASNSGCSWTDLNEDGTIDVNDWRALFDTNEKEAELLFAFDDVDQRVREVVKVLDPDTGNPANGDGTVLVERFFGFLEDGNPLGFREGMGLHVQLDGFEADDFVLQQDPDEFLRRTTMLTADEGGVDIQSAVPLTAQMLEQVGPTEDYRWRTKDPFPMVFLPDDVRVGDTLEVDVKLRFPPSLESDPVEIGHSYAERLEHVVASCSFAASVSGGASGSWSGLVATVDAQSGWLLGVRETVGVMGGLPPFIATVGAAQAGAGLPGQILSMSVEIPGVPGESYSWNESIQQAIGLGPPSLSLASFDGETYLGQVSGTLVDGVLADRKSISVTLDFDADLIVPGVVANSCVR